TGQIHSQSGTHTKIVEVLFPSHIALPGATQSGIIHRHAIHVREIRVAGSSDGVAQIGGVSPTCVCTSGFTNSTTDIHPVTGIAKRRSNKSFIERHQCTNGFEGGAWLIQSFNGPVDEGTRYIQHQAAEIAAFVGTRQVVGIEYGT